MGWVRVSIAEVERRAGDRPPGYVEALKAAARPDPDGQHLLIDADRLDELKLRYGLFAGQSTPCCGG
jgi:hypothetical protein